MDYGYLNGTNYNPNVPFGENWADWSSAAWGGGWAPSAGGVARQLGLSGRAMAEFARAVNNQKRRLAEAASGGYYGYKPEMGVPEWIRDLYMSQGTNTGPYQQQYQKYGYNAGWNPSVRMYSGGAMPTRPDGGQINYDVDYADLPRGARNLVDRGGARARDSGGSSNRASRRARARDRMRIRNR